MTYYAFSICDGETPSSNQLSMSITFGTHTALCRFYFDTDTISDTFNHWVACIDVLDEDIPERSFVMNPDSIYYADDDIFSVVIRSDLAAIGHDDLQHVVFIIGTHTNEET